MGARAREAPPGVAPWRTLALLVVSLALVAPWAGRLTPVPLLLLFAPLAVMWSRLDASLRAERAILAAWIAVEVAVAVGVALAGTAAAGLLVLIVVPVMALITSRSPRLAAIGRGARRGVDDRGGVLASENAVLDQPPFLIAPVAAAITAAALTLAPANPEKGPREEASLDPLAGLLSRDSPSRRVAEIEASRG